MTCRIAVVGMACRYPDARSPVELWENVLAQRRAFRRLPRERLNLADYYSALPETPDATYATEAALIEGYEFDRTRFRIAGDTFRSTDMAHWLALDVASDALADAGYPDGKGLPRESSGVLLGNSLTGEFSRANLMRLRWPYVRRVVDASLAKTDWSVERRRAYLAELEVEYKAPFPPVGDESLAGGLSNTIAGRICNHFDLQGGGYTVDGACASSLLAISNACSALVAGDLDVALAGGVDLSLDPFELVGFAKVGALATKDMRVFDAHSSGFWPGEGCGCVVLMRFEDAVRQCRRIDAVIRGWGISSDGSGGLTRPEVAGQRLALRRAYRRAGIGIEAVGFFEGHGTGTEVGDATELRALSQTLRAAPHNGSAVPIGSIKANIGHAKAAAGVAGFIKATLAVQNQLIPPSTGWEDPHPALADEGHALHLLREGMPWPSDVALVAGVSGMGFGGINAHVVVEGPVTERRSSLTVRERSLLTSRQDAELFLLDGSDRSGLLQHVEQLRGFASRVSLAELTDLAARLTESDQLGVARAAIVASSPAELQQSLDELAVTLEGDEEWQNASSNRFMVGQHAAPPRIGFLFSGQGAPANLAGGLWRRRFDAVSELYRSANLPHHSDGVATEVAQPAIVTACLAGLRVLHDLGLRAHLAIGHSLGELVAYHWAGAMDEAALRRIVEARGQAMAQCKSGGGMACVVAAEPEVRSLLADRNLVIAGLNSPKQTVVSGEAAAIDAFVADVRSRGIQATRLNVSHGFHSPLVADSASALSQALASEQMHALKANVVSTVTGAALEPHDDLRNLMVRQLTSPVKFVDALRAGDRQTDLWIELGPGNVLQGIVNDSTSTPVVALDAGGKSLRPLLHAVGMAYVRGAPVEMQALFHGRFRRPFDLNWRPRFFVNPCERAPRAETPLVEEVEQRSPVAESLNEVRSRSATAQSGSDLRVRPAALEIVRQLAADRAELPLSAVAAEDRLLNDLHLSSIAVSQLVTDAARAMDLAPPASATDAANATVAELALSLEEMASLGQPRRTSDDALPAGVASWTRSFDIGWVERPRLEKVSPRRLEVPAGQWHLLAPENHVLANGLRQAINVLSGDGVIVCLPKRFTYDHVELLLEAARRVIEAPRSTKLILVTSGGVGPSFAKSLVLEFPDVTTQIVHTSDGDPGVIERIMAEAEAAEGFGEVRYDVLGKRHEPVLRLLAMPDEEIAIPLDADDVLLVTGGGKGIAAECAFSLAKETGVRLALWGRSQIENDEQLAANLKRMSAAGIDFRYQAVDVTCAEAVKAAVSNVRSELGEVTAFLHAAGVNVPRRLEALDRQSVFATLRPKVDGAVNVLAAIDSELLRMFVSFGSIIGRSGMRGQADYALANEWLTRLTEDWQADHPHCSCLALEWSVWAGVGMGERLGTVDVLKEQGISPISIDQGLQALRQRISIDSTTTTAVVTGRFGQIRTLKLEASDLPLLRFLEHPRVIVPGVEIVADANLSLDTDPYLKDHVYQRVPLLPAVMGLEAMVQVARALAEVDELPVLEHIRFDQPVAISAGEGVTLRVAALRRASDQIEVVLRSSETDFQEDHFRTTCKFGSATPVLTKSNGRVADGNGIHGLDGAPRLAINPLTDLYGGILFHTGRFQRLRGYRRLQARECIAEISPSEPDPWFGHYLPSELVLGDAAVRDTMIHAVQACIPHHTLLPIGVERITFTGKLAGPVTLHAREISDDGDLFVYDLEVVDTRGRLCEQWTGLRLRRVNDVAVGSTLGEALLGPYLERRVSELLAVSDVAVVVQRNGDVARQARGQDALRLAVGTPVEVHRRPDGKPEVDAGHEVSLSHADELTMGVAGPDTIACDVERIVTRADHVWRDLLGDERKQLAQHIASRCDEDLARAHTRVWAAQECLRKSGYISDGPLVFQRSTSDRWVVLTSGSLSIATWSALGSTAETGMIFAVLARSQRARV